jgi:hypothetical protein
MSGKPLLPELVNPNFGSCTSSTVFTVVLELPFI